MNKTDLVRAVAKALEMKGTQVAPIVDEVLKL